jgi:hypothetical protein
MKVKTFAEKLADALDEKAAWLDYDPIAASSLIKVADCIRETIKELREE